jgi:hypothetical protein
VGIVESLRLSRVTCGLSAGAVGFGSGVSSCGGSRTTSSRVCFAFKEELNPFEIAKQQFNRAADYLDLDSSMRHVLENAKRQLIVSIPVKDGWRRRAGV